MIPFGDALWLLLVVLYGPRSLMMLLLCCKTCMSAMVSTNGFGVCLAPPFAAIDASYGLLSKPLGLLSKPLGLLSKPLGFFVKAKSFCQGHWQASYPFWQGKCFVQGWSCWASWQQKTLLQHEIMTFQIRKKINKKITNRIKKENNKEINKNQVNARWKINININTYWFWKNQYFLINININKNPCVFIDQDQYPMLRVVGSFTSKLPSVIFWGKSTWQDLWQGFKNLRGCTLS